VPMIEPDRPSNLDLDVEALVRGHLDREAERIDPRPLFSKILADLPAPKAAMVLGASCRRRTWRWVSIAAAVLLIATVVTFFWRDRTVLAKGETVVREAQRAHSVPIDRCYLVEVRRESSLAAELAPNLPQVRLTRLWTRGDRFWVESARSDQHWAWGRDVSNRFWIAFGPHTALRMEADEVPDWLNLYCDLHSLNVEQLLGDVLSRFDLTRETGPSSSEASTIRVTAKAKAPEIPRPVPTIGGAEIEIDADSRVIRRMVLRRIWNGEPFATVTYSLLENDALDPSAYQLEGHLSDPSDIFTRDHEPQRRKELLARWFGARAGRGLRSLETPRKDR
jgi:hypothetical protein